MFSRAIAVFSVPIQEKRNKCQTSTVQVLYVIYECNVLNVFPPVWCFMKGGRICYNYKSCPPLNGCHFELSHFCLPQENLVNNDY